MFAKEHKEMAAIEQVRPGAAFFNAHRPGVVAGIEADALLNDRLVPRLGLTKAVLNSSPRPSRAILRTRRLAAPATG